MSDERTTMGIFPARRSIAGFVQSATNAVTVVVTLVFIAGLISAGKSLSGIRIHHSGFDLNLFGLVAGPALLARTRSDHWTSLILLTGEALRRPDVRGIFEL